MAYVLALLLVAAFTANVAVGAVSGRPPLGNVAEAVLLFAAAIAFTAAILRSEARAKTRGGTKEEPRTPRAL